MIAVQGTMLVCRLSRAAQGTSVNHVLTVDLRIPERLVQTLLAKSLVTINTKRATGESIVSAGQMIRVDALPYESYGVAVEANVVQVLYEDDHALVVDKPSHMIAYPSAPTDTGTLAGAVAFHYMQTGVQRKVRHIHRLDRDTTGAVLFAKHALAAPIFDEQLRERRITRRYVAIIHGQLPQKELTIDAPIGRDRHVSGRQRVAETGKRAVTHVRVLESWPRASLVEARLDTGRTHQIRVHLAHIGSPIYGDTLYGKADHGIARQALHAEQITFVHPYSNEAITVECPWPDDLKAWVQRLRASSD